MSDLDLSETLAQVLARLNDLDRRVRQMELARPGPVPAVRVPPPPPPTPPVEPEPSPVLQVPQFAPAATPTRDPEVQLETQVGLTWLNRIGALTVVLGIAFFFRYAVDRGLIGETGRVLLGALTAFAALGVAEWLWRRGQHRVYAQGITGAGISILYLSIYAAFGFYRLIPQFGAGALLFFATVLAVALALRYNAIAIAALGLVGGYLTPLLLASDVDHPWTLLAYLLFLLAGGLTLVQRKGWSYLEPLLVAGTSLVHLLWAMKFGARNETVATVSIFAFYALFWRMASREALFAAQLLAGIQLAIVWAEPGSTGLWFSLALSGAALAGAVRRSWPGFSLTGFILFWLTAVFWRRNEYAQLPVSALLAFTAAFTLFFGWVVWRASFPADSEQDAAPDSDLAMLALNGAVYFVLCYSLLNPFHHSSMGLFAVALAGLHGWAAWRIASYGPPYTATEPLPRRLYPAILCGGVALALVTLAVVIQFSQFRITMAWALEAAILAWVGGRQKSSRLEAAAGVVFTLALARLIFVDAGMYLDSAIPHTLLVNARLLTFLITGVALWLGGRWMSRPAAAIAYICGHLVVLWALLAETLDWASQRTSMGDPASIGTLAASVLLAVYGIALVVLGVATRSRFNRVLGLVLLGVVVLKLYVYDVWQLEQTFRIVAFVVLGLLLLTASFLYSRFRSVIGKLLDDSATGSTDPSP